jgi:hypothetical protein
MKTARLSALAVVVALIASSFGRASGAEQPVGKQVGPGPKKVEAALGAPSDLRARIRYTDYRAGDVELRWRDNSSAEDAFALVEATHSDCRSWGPNREDARFPANTTSGTWTVAPGSFIGIGRLRAHSAILNFTCPQDYALVALNESDGNSSPSNTIELIADAPNTPKRLRYRELPGGAFEVGWRYTPKGYPMDTTGTTCFFIGEHLALDNPDPSNPFSYTVYGLVGAVGSVTCAGPCYWCGGAFYTRDGDDYTVQFTPGVNWFGAVPECLQVSAVVGTHGAPQAQYSSPSAWKTKCIHGPDVQEA